MVIDAELKNQIKATLETFIESTEPDKMDLRRIARDLNALPLLLDMGGCYALRPNGEIVSFAWDDERNDEVEHNSRIRNMALLQGSKKYPELKDLVQTKSTNDIDCPDCNGTGTHPISVKLGMENITRYCGGLDDTNG